MLAKYWRLRVLNKTDQTLTYDNAARLTIKASPWKLVSGNLSYGTVISDDMGLGGGGSIAADAETEGDVQDNTSNLYWGINGLFEAIADATSTDGILYLYLEESENNSDWPSDAADFDITKHMTLIAALEFSTDAVDEKASVNFIIV